MMMAGVLHPPFFLFLAKEKERMRRARCKKEKDGAQELPCLDYESLRTAAWYRRRLPKPGMAPASLSLPLT